MCITSISTAPKIDYLPDIIGSKTKRGKTGGNWDSAPEVTGTLLMMVQS